MDKLGVSVKPLPDEEKARLQISYGLIVNAIRAGKMKQEGAVKGTIILRVNNVKMESIEDWEEAVKAANQSSDRALWIQALTPSGRKQSIVIDLNE